MYVCIYIYTYIYCNSTRISTQFQQLHVLPHTRCRSRRSSPRSRTALSVCNVRLYQPLRWLAAAICLSCLLRNSSRQHAYKVGDPQRRAICAKFTIAYNFGRSVMSNLRIASVLGVVHKALQQLVWDGEVFFSATMFRKSLRVAHAARASLHRGPSLAPCLSNNTPQNVSRESRRREACNR